MNTELWLENLSWADPQQNNEGNERTILKWASGTGASKDGSGWKRLRISALSVQTSGSTAEKLVNIFVKKLLRQLVTHVTSNLFIYQFASYEVN